MLKSILQSATVPLVALSLTLPVIAADFSFTGNLNNPNSVQSFNFLVGGLDPTQVDIRTFSYGGGQNSEGTFIPFGGFDPEITLWDSNGQYIEDNDDNGVGFPENPNTGSSYDSLLSLLLDPGSYVLTLAYYSNDRVSDSLADGYENDQRDFDDLSSAWALDILGVTSAELGEVLGPDEESVFVFHRAAENTVFLTDLGAIASTTVSALPFALAQREIQFDAARTPVRDLNGRLFRLRSRSSQQEVQPPAPESIALDKNGKPSGASKDSKKIVVMDAMEVAPIKTFGVYVSGDFSASDQDGLSQVAGFDTETWSGTVGFEYSPVEALTLGLGVSYLSSEADLGYLGDVEVEGVSVSPYVSYYKDGFYADALYSAGFMENEFSRNTLVSGHADADSDSLNHIVELHAGYNIELGKVITGPILGGEYINGTLDGYTERRGGTANVVASEQDYESLVSELGWQISVPLEVGSVKVTPQLRASWKHQFANDGEDVSVALAESPYVRVRDGQVSRRGGFSAHAESEAPGEDYASLGAGVAFGFGDVSVILDYEGEYFREDNVTHFASIRAGVKF